MARREWQNVWESQGGLKSTAGVAESCGDMQGELFDL